MDKKTRLIILLAIFIVGIAGAGLYFPLKKTGQDQTVTTGPAVVPDSLFGWKYPTVVFPTPSTTAGYGKNLFDLQIAFSSIRDPGGIPQGLPVRLKIPIIGVDSPVEDALITPEGRMDVPQGSVNVAWFALGPHPGRVGSAVIGGHFGINNGVKYVFYDLDKLKVGDKIYVLDDEGNTLAFQVRSIKLFERDDDATTVFTSSDQLAHLNLITCEGVWNQSNGLYPQRRVVFTDSIAPEGAIVVNPTVLPGTGTITPGPTPTPTPTPTPSSGVTPTPTPTTVPSQNPQTSSTSQTIIQNAKSLFATPLDALATSALLISIGFVAFRIFRRED